LPTQDQLGVLSKGQEVYITCPFGGEKTFEQIGRLVYWDNKTCITKNGKYLVADKPTGKRPYAIPTTVKIANFIDSKWVVIETFEDTTQDLSTGNGRYDPMDLLPFKVSFISQGRYHIFHVYPIAAIVGK
jgi:hypothetical protein